jgi:hypothetical protein
MLAIKPANREPESLANVLIVCRFCGRNAKWSDLGRSDLSVYFIELRGSQRGTSPAGMGRRHGVLEQRGAEISKLRQGRKSHDRHYCLRQCGALRIGKCRKAGRAENNDRGQNEKSESNSEYRSNQSPA